MALYIVQRLEGTAPYFAAGCFLFILISTVAFNIAGGLTRASGAYIFFYSTLVVIVGICYKAFLGEAADSHLLDPRTDIEVYVAGIAGMCAMAYIARAVRRRNGLLARQMSDRTMYLSSIGCMVCGAFISFGIALLGDAGRQLQSAFAQLNELIPLGIIIGTVYEIRSSNGRRSTNLACIVGGAYFFLVFGVAGFSKQGMLTPMVCWLLPVWVMGYRLSRAQVLMFALTLFVIFHDLVPIAQYGKSFSAEDLTTGERFAIAAHAFDDLDNIKKEQFETQMFLEEENTGSYFDSPQGFWERLTFVSIDDTLIRFTDDGHILGLAPIAETIWNAIPRVFWPNKPDQKYGGNFYGREMGRLSSEDTTTGISFSPTAEAYHLEGWIGITLLAPILWLGLFVVFDSLFGDTVTTPWGMLAAVNIAHIAPEGGVVGIVHLLTFGVEIFAFCALFAIWVAPIVGSVVTGGRTSTASYRRTQPAGDNV